MLDVRTRKAGLKSQAPARQTADKRLPPTPQGSSPPFLLGPRGPAFPLEVRVPPHRGALIVSAPSGPLPIPAMPEYLITDAPARKSASKKARKAAGINAPVPAKPKPKRKSAGPKTRKAAPAAKVRAVRKAASPPALAEPVQITSAEPAPQPAPPPTAQAPEPPPALAPAPFPVLSAPLMAATPNAPITLAERTAFTPQRRDRALVRSDNGLVARVVAWLGGLMPRKRRAALPRARTRLDRAPASAAAQIASPPSGDADNNLAHRMMLQLSQENERLRRELEALRAAMGAPAST
jgi:hypothetical protein